MNVNARLSEDAVALIDALAKEDLRTRSDMIRILLKEAVEARQRAGWRPPTPPKDAPGKR